MMTLGIGLYLFGITMIKEIRHMFRSFNQMITNKTPRTKVMEQIIEAIQFSELKP